MYVELIHELSFNPWIVSRTCEQIMTSLFYTICISVDIIPHVIFRAKAFKVGIKLCNNL